MALQIALAVASGKPAFGSVPVDQGDVLYLALEDSRRRLRDRLEQIGAVRPTTLDLTLDTRKVNSGFIKDLSEWLSRHPTARLVIVDTLAKIKPTRKRNVDIYAEDSAVMSRLQSIALQHQICLPENELGIGIPREQELLVLPVILVVVGHEDPLLVIRSKEPTEKSRCTGNYANDFHDRLPIHGSPLNPPHRSTTNH